MNGFQAQVNQYPAPGVEGSFASNNPMSNAIAGAGAFVVGQYGATVARFVWSPDLVTLYNTGNAAANVGVPIGFLANEQQGLNTVFLSPAGMTMTPGAMAEPFTRGDFWAKVSAASTGINQKAFANLNTGAVYPAATGAPPQTFAGTASFATNVMTVVTETSGTITLGTLITSAGVAAGTYVSGYGTGNGSTGTYTLSTAPGTIATQAATGTAYVETPFCVLSSANSGELAKIGLGN